MDPRIHHTSIHVTLPYKWKLRLHLERALRHLGGSIMYLIDKSQLKYKLSIKEVWLGEGPQMVWLKVKIYSLS